MTFASTGEPGAHGFGQAFRLDSKARFYKAIGEWKRVVKFGLASEIAHAKVIEPVERAWPALGACNHLDAEFSSVHRVSISRRRATPEIWCCANSLPLQECRTRIAVHLCAWRPIGASQSPAAKQIHHT